MSQRLSELYVSVSCQRRLSNSRRSSSRSLKLLSDIVILLTERQAILFEMGFKALSGKILEGKRRLKVLT